MNIRFANAEDVELCVAVDELMGFKSKREALERAQMQNELIVAEEDGSPRAYLWFCMVWGDLPFINLIRVVPDFQGKGIGKAIYQFFENHFKNQAVEWLLSSTELTNERSIAFHKRLGFDQIGRWDIASDDVELFFKKVLE